jgi:putative transposase
MPNHFHLVAWPTRGTDLSAFMMWALGTHSKRWHQFRGSGGTGAVYQNRFKAFPVGSDRHFLTVCRYVERNPLRARLVNRAERWPWSSLAQRLGWSGGPTLTPWPVPQPLDWLDQVNQDDVAAETNRVRSSIRLGRTLDDVR